VHAQRWRETGFVAVEGPKVVNPSFRTGQMLRFRLHANPTVRKWAYRKERKGRRPEGKRVGLYTEQEQREWLDRKAEEGGFELLQVKVAPQRADGPTCVQDAVVRDQRVFGRRPGWHCDHFDGRHEPRQLTHLAVTFDGLLRVIDPDLFRCTLERGIGSAKAFGFGLLSLARAE
jgi:CRISPR system Cascade subunit CasE